MREAVEITEDVIKKVRSLLADPELQYWPVVKREDGPVIPYFGGVSIETRATAAGPAPFYMLGRKHGWANVLVITADRKVLLVIQPKPGLGVASLEMPAGGVGEIIGSISNREIIRRATDRVTKETGYAGTKATYLGFSIIETGKFFDPGAQEPWETGVGRGFKAHCILVEGAIRTSSPETSATDKIVPILVPASVVPDLITNGLLLEAGALNCFQLAHLKGHLDQYF